jgi:hypothetical protein
MTSKTWQEEGFSSARRELESRITMLDRHIDRGEQDIEEARGNLRLSEEGLKRNKELRYGYQKILHVTAE